MPLSLRNPSLPLLPLSEEQPLFLVGARELVAPSGEQVTWDETTVLARGEKRNISLHIRLKHGSRGRKIRMFEVPEGASLTVTQLIEAEADAEWHGVFLVRGGGEVRIRRALHVFGSGVRVRLHCLSVLENSGRMSADEEVFSHYENGVFDIRTHFVLKEEAQAIARARLVLGEHARGSQATENLHALALSDHAKMRSIPELEVRTENVRCSHQASCLPLDGEKQFYLQSRGLQGAQAKMLLARAFAWPILEQLPEALQKQQESFLFGEYV